MCRAHQMNIGGHRWANRNNSNVPRPIDVTFYSQIPASCGCSKIGTEVNEVPNQNQCVPYARCGLDKTVAWP